MKMDVKHFKNGCPSHIISFKNGCQTFQKWIKYTPFVQLRCERIGYASVRDRAQPFYSNMAVQRPIVPP